MKEYMYTMTMSYREIKRVKEELVKILRSRLSEEALRRALRDTHSRRAPRACGLTVHVGIGCPNRCLYCYIQDMGFRFTETRPYPLSGLELVAAIAHNPYIVPGIQGTYLAFGSISDPFYPTVVVKTLDYFNNIERFMRNPCQFSTKMTIDDEVIEAMRRLDLVISPLVTIVTITRHRELEPRAPDPWTRFDTIRRLRKGGLQPFLFLRPLIPGIIENEIDELMDEAKRAGAVGVVIGGFRVTKTILRRLERAGVKVDELRRRLRGRLRGTKQVNLNLRDLKELALEVAKERGLIGLLSACCAMTNVLNLHGYRLACANVCFAEGLCVLKKGYVCKARCPEKVPKVDEDDIKEAIEEVLKARGLTHLYIDREYIEVHARALEYNEGALRFLQTVYRRRIVIRR